MRGSTGRGVAVVTGGGGGIGLAISHELAARGYEVAAVDLVTRSPNSPSGPHGSQILLHVADATGVREADEVVKRVLDRWGRIDVLVNNVGGSPGGRQPLEETQEDDWSRVIALNLTTTFRWSRAVASAMRAQRSGSIVNVSSQTALVGTHHLVAAYPAAKAGVLGLTRQLARELGPWGIRVNAVAPGLILSNPDVEAEWAQRSEGERAAFLQSVPLRRIGNPSEVANVIAFLASDDAAYVSGQTILVNGGQHFG